MHRRLYQILDDCHVAPEIELLEDHAELASDPLHRSGVGVFLRAVTAAAHLYQLAFDENFSGIRHLQQIDAAQERAFARSAAAQDYVMLMGSQRNAFQNLMRTEPFLCMSRTRSASPLLPKWPTACIPPFNGIQLIGRPCPGQQDQKETA
jgi:hypothetical protein